MSQKNLYEELETELTNIEKSIDDLAKSLDLNPTEPTEVPSQTDKPTDPAQTDKTTELPVEPVSSTIVQVETELPTEEETPDLPTESSVVPDPEAPEPDETNVEEPNKNVETVQKSNEENKKRVRYFSRFGRLPYETGTIVKHNTRILLSMQNDIADIINNPILNVKAFRDSKFRDNSEKEQTICNLTDQSSKDETEFCNNLNDALKRIEKNTGVVNNKEASETTLNELQSDRGVVDDSTKKINENKELKQLIIEESIENEVSSIKEVNILILF